MDSLIYNSDFLIGKIETFSHNEDILLQYWTKASGSPENEIRYFLNTDLIVCNKYKEEEYSKIFIKHFKSFIHKWENRPETFNDSVKFFVANTVKEILTKIIPLEPNFLTLDFTDDRSILFKIIINHYNIYLELFGITEGFEIESILNIYHNKVSIYSYGGEISECISKIKKYSLPDIMSQCENELSDSFIT